MENNDNLTKLIDHILEENKELKDKVNRLEEELRLERALKNIPQIPTTPQPFEPYYEKPFWVDGPTCDLFE